MYVSLQITANLTIIFAPFLPFSMDKLRGFLNMDELNWSNLGRTNLMLAGHKVNTPELLFEKIEDSVIEKQVTKLLETKKANEAANATVTPAKENCTFDDFNKMDIRTGTIIEAERIPKTKKLLKLKIDTGIDKRTVVSGIAEYYSPEEIIGQQVSILVNLEPRELKGIQSQGMILMAQDVDGSLKFVTPVQPVKNGSEIK
jgi:methionyl-tRNA synthetase